MLPWVPNSWAIYVGDQHGNLALVYRDEAISCAEPVPLVPRPAPHALPPAPHDTHRTDAEAELMLVSVSHGLPDVPPGTVRNLRILEDVPRKGVHSGGVITTAATSIYTVKRIVGIVPVEADGSARFRVPANRNVYFEALDADRREVQRMRSVVCLKPGETRTCVGCHEQRTTAPPVLRASATSRPASQPAQMPWGDRVMSYLRDVQPVLNARCIQCHSFSRETNGVILTEDLTDQFCVSYEELVPYLTVANAMRWDNPEDVLPRPAYTYGSRISPLMKLLDAGHYGVRLSQEEQDRLATWTDANGVYYDRYESTYSDARRILTDETKKTLADVFERRCASCHGGGDGAHGTWWMAVNWRDPARSRALQAPLSRSAGGWGLCAGTVFQGTQDPDYQLLLQTLTGLHKQLTDRPREDLLSVRGSDMERIVPALPPLPEPRTRPAGPPPGDWVWLTDLQWQKASSGWSVTGDGLPRKDTDIEGRPLSLGAWGYERGIGTHAHSEITYALDGAYTRFWAQVGGAESGGTVVFRVLGDGKLLYDSGVMKGLRGSKRIDVSIEGVRELCLEVTDAGDGIIADEANWAEAKLLRGAE